MTDMAMIHALACRMFDGYSVQVSSKYDEIFERVREENKATRLLSDEISDKIYSNFMEYTHKNSYTKRITQDAYQRLKKWDDDWSVQHIVAPGQHITYSMCRVDIKVPFIGEAVKAEKLLKFAQDMIDQRKEGIVLTLPIREEFVKILANYENNKRRADDFMEKEFQWCLEEAQAYREKLHEIKKVVEGLLEERNRKNLPELTEVKTTEAKQNVSVEVVVKVNGDVVNSNKSICQRFTNWWKSV